MHIESGCGFIQKQQIRIAANRQRKESALLLASRKLPKEAISDAVQACSSGNLRHRQRMRIIRRKQVNVFTHSQRFRDSAHLQHGPGAAAVLRLARITSKDPNFAFVGLQ